MNKTAFALRQSAEKPVVRPEDMADETVLQAAMPESS
jgi:hypothetical protein